MFKQFYSDFTFFPSSAMANLLQAKENPCFGMYNVWTELGANGTPKNSILDGLKQPETITIMFTIGPN